MNEHWYGILAGLWISTGYAFLFTDTVQSLKAPYVVAVLTIVGSGVILSLPARNIIDRNMLIAMGVTFIGWLALSLGVGNYFLPIFGNVGGTLPGQFLYLICGAFLLPVLLLSYLVAIIIRKIKSGK